MIRNLVRKEIMVNLLSLRFTFTLLLSILLFAVSSFVYVARYEQQSQDYWKQTNENLSKFSDNAKQLYKLAFLQQKFWRRPKPLTLCVEGFERYLPNLIDSSVFFMRLPEIGGRENFLLRRYSDIDWFFIISVPMSFVALLFTYDSFCGEKETGTLRLILSSSIPRYKILVGKYLGALAALAIPLFAGLLINLIIVLASGIVDINSADWLRFFAIFLLSILFMSVFLLLGIFVSSRVSHSISSIVILLLIWAGMIVLIPSLGRIVAETSVNVLTPAEFHKRFMENLQQMEHDAETGKYGKNAHELWHEDRNNPLVNPPAAARFCNAKAASMNKLWEQQHNQMLAQAYAGRNFASISPAVIYQRASEILAGTGIRRCVNLYWQVKRYRENLQQYILDQDAEDPNSLHLLFDNDFSVEMWGTISKKPVDFSTVPKFQEQDYPVAESFHLAMWDIGVLLLWNLVIFTAAFVSFLRYDVR